MNCKQCGHPEDDHGPESGRWTDGRVIPGRLCYHEENQGYQEDLCPCSGFDEEIPAASYFQTLCAKAGV